MPDDYEYVDSIEALSKLCDERGLEHWDSEAMACETHIFVDKAGNPHECWEAPDGMVNVVISMSPEQAVELGRGKCHNTEEYPFIWSFTCSECGVHSMTEGRGFNFCPRCGRKVVDE